eukprot:scaffold59109_cov67-Phaeocystis_antarctica.AAC.1
MSRTCRGPSRRRRGLSRHRHWRVAARRAAVAVRLNISNVWLIRANRAQHANRRLVANAERSLHVRQQGWGAAFRHYEASRHLSSVGCIGDHAGLAQRAVVERVEMVAKQQRAILPRFLVAWGTAEAMYLRQTVVSCITVSRNFVLEYAGLEKLSPTFRVCSVWALYDLLVVV